MSNERFRQMSDQEKLKLCIYIKDEIKSLKEHGNLIKEINNKLCEQSNVINKNIIN